MLVILSGVAGAGKSSLISTLVCQALDQGFPSFVYSGELSNQSLKNWIASVHAGQRGMNCYETGTGSKYYKIRSEASKVIDQYYRGKLFFYKDGFTHKTSKLFATMESAVRIHGVKFIVLDNMSSIDTEAKDDGSDKWTKQDAFIRDIIDFSKKWNVVCLVVLHPKKLDTLRRMSIFDLQGVVSAVNLSHRVIALYRVTPKEKEGILNKAGKMIEPPVNYDVLLDVLKDRFGSGANKTIGLYYDQPSRRFFDSYESLNHQYDWDKTDYGDTPLPYGIPQFEVENEVFGAPMVMSSRYSS